ncbi:hypothetical protein FN846DRAFT_888650 [Sphaerosporella brunnea]|uniref:Uncharacterized protein n=1 Tax=Sphaerosporella brunnea TaxID=1250544 RepID=A0A5J5F2M9_9PEZI|nr:hypothetical protein FN846DRAFT_888650 [Sphaerosporella brunnea]
MFAKIDRTRTAKEFYLILGDAKFQKYNFGINRTYGTIEFRQAEAHGDHERAIKWAETLSALVTGSLLTEPWEWVAWGRMVVVGGVEGRLPPGVAPGGVGEVRARCPPQSLLRGEAPGQVGLRGGEDAL